MLEAVALLPEQIPRHPVVVRIVRHKLSLLEVLGEPVHAFAGLPAERVRQLNLVVGVLQADAVRARGPAGGGHHGVQQDGHVCHPHQLDVALDDFGAMAGQGALDGQFEPHDGELDPVGCGVQGRMEEVLQVAELLRGVDRVLLEEPGDDVGRVHGRVAIFADRFVG